MLNVALFGPPGAGKGTQSDYLIQQYGLTYISTGDLLRKEIKSKTKLGLAAQDIIAEGGLVSDEIIVQIIENTITENPDSGGFLFDGFPRTYIQAYILEGLMLKLNTHLNCLISIDVPEEESVSRLLNRGITSGRSDDNETVIRTRLREYHDKTLPVLQFYKDKGIYCEVDGRNGVDKVHNDIVRIIEKELSKKLLNIVMFGYPGSGRGTQGSRLAKQFGLEYVATGSLLQNQFKEDTQLNKKLMELYENGDLLPDEIVIKLIERLLSDTSNIKGFIFKGYPRTLVQSYILDGLLKRHDSSITMVLEIVVPTLDLIKRLDERSHTDRSMPYDMSTANIVRRLKQHEANTFPVIDKYDKAFGVKKIDGMGTVDEVYERIAAEVASGFKQIR
jgi:adenylate kinase